MQYTIYKVITFSVNDILHDAVKQRVISTNTLKHFFYYKVNMANEKKRIKTYLMTISIFDLGFLNPDVYILKTEWSLDRKRTNE